MLCWHATTSSPVYQFARLPNYQLPNSPTSMVIGACSIELRIPGNRSLKDKRHVLKPLLTRLRREFNVRTGIRYPDDWQGDPEGNYVLDVTN